MPLLPSCIHDALVASWIGWLPVRPEFDPSHPLGCHRRRIADEVVIGKFIEKVVTGLGWERLEVKGVVSATTLRNRFAEFIALDIASKLLDEALSAFEKMIGLHEGDLAADGSKSKAPCGGEVAGRSGVDRGKQGINTHVVVEGHGVPIGLDVDKAGRPDHCMLEATIIDVEHRLAAITGGITGATIDLDRGYDYKHTYTDLEKHQMDGRVRKRGHAPVPLRFDNRWKSERTHAWMHNYRVLIYCTERTRPATEFWIHLTAAIVTIRQLIHHARNRYRWDTRPTTRRLR